MVNNIDFLSSLGELALASRLKRLSEFVMKSAGEVYVYHNINFEPKWFPVFYFLSEKGETGIMDIAEALKISHPAVIQIAKELEKNGLIISNKSKTDARKRHLKLTKKGNNLLPQLQIIWQKIKTINTSIIEKLPNNLMHSIINIEVEWQSETYIERLKKLDKING